MVSQFKSMRHIFKRIEFLRPAIAFGLSLVMHGLLVFLIMGKNPQDGGADRVMANLDVAKPLEVSIISSDTSQSDTPQVANKTPSGANLQYKNQLDKFKKVQVQRKNVPILVQNANLRTYYHHIEELTTPPIVQDNVEPSVNLTLTMDEVPEKPLQLRLLVNENGDIDDIEIEESKLSEEATRIVKEQFLKMKFAPGLIGDFAVKSQFVIEVSLSAAARRPEFIEVSRKVLR